MCVLGVGAGIFLAWRWWARPPVILVVVDTLRADHLTQHGYGRATSATLGRLASHSTRFAQCFAPAPWTTPSTASILTGLLPARHGSSRKGIPLADEATSLAEILSAEGYETAAFTLNHNVSRKTRFDQGFEVFLDFEGKSTDYPDIREMLDQVGTWLEIRRAAPFLLWLQPMNVHGPYRVPKARRSDLLGSPPTPGFRYYGEPMRGILKRGQVELREAVDEAMLRSLVERYDTAIRYTFDELAGLVEDLEERGLYDRSLIVVTSDHGEELFEHGGFSHGYTLHREVLEVPLWIKLPGQREGGVVDELVSTVDVVPTVLDALGLDPRSPLDGRSLLPLIRGDERDGDEPFQIYEVQWPKRCVARAIRMGSWKLVRIEQNYEGVVDAVRLYDLATDPGEDRNVASEHPERVARMTEELEATFARYEAEALPVPESVEDQMDRKKLEALGYL